MSADDPWGQPVDQRFESQYRRAYMNGATEVLYLLAHKLTPEELEMVTNWVDDHLVPWTLNNLDTTKKPPSFPVLDGQRPRRHGMWF